MRGGGGWGWGIQTDRDGQTGVASVFRSLTLEANALPLGHARQPSERERLWIIDTQE